MSHASGKRRHGGLGVKVLFEGLKQLSRGRDEVGRKVPGRATKGLRTKNVSPQRTEGFKWLGINTMASRGEIGRNT